MSDSTAQESSAVSQTIVSRVTQLPVVTSTYSLASHYYGLAKASNALVGKTLATAETTLNFAVEKVKPVVDRLEKPIAVVDNLACKALDKLEEKYPVITRTPEEIANDTKKYYTNAVQPAVQRYESVKQLGTATVTTVKEFGYRTAEDLLASAYGKDLLVKLSNALHTADEYLDYYLPPPADQNDAPLNTEDPMASNVTKLAAKAKSRIREQMLSRKDAVQLRVTDARARLSGFLNVETMATKLEMSKQSVLELVSPLQQKAKVMWDQLEVDSTDCSEKSFQQRMVLNAKWATVNAGNKGWQTLQSAASIFIRPRITDASPSTN